MELKQLQKAIHDAAMAVRAGDWSQYDKLQDLRKQHRAACGVPEAVEEAPAAPEAEVSAAESETAQAEPKKGKRQKKDAAAE